MLYGDGRADGPDQLYAAVSGGLRVDSELSAVGRLQPDHRRTAAAAVRALIRRSDARERQLRVLGHLGHATDLSARVCSSGSRTWG